jgi:hypothetical protein
LSCRGAAGSAACALTGDGIIIALTAAAGPDGTATAGFESAPWDAPLDVAITVDGEAWPLSRMRCGPFGLALLRDGEALDRADTLTRLAGTQAPRTDPTALGVYMWRSPRPAAGAPPIAARPVALEDATGGAGVDQELDGDVKRILQELGYVK